MADNFWEKDSIVKSGGEWWSQDQVAKKPEAPAKEAGFSLKDLAASFGVGALGSTKALTDVAGAENIVSEKLGSGVEGLQRAMTPERQAEMQRQAARMKAAEESGSTLQEIKAGALNVAEAPLQSAAQAIGSFIPYLLSTPVAAGMRLTGASKAAIEAVSRQAPKAIATAQGAGAVKGAIYEGVLQAEIEAGVDPELAKQKADAAQSYFGGNIEQIALGAGLGLAAGSSGVEKFLTPAGRAGAAPSMTRRVAEAIVKESIPEAAQGGQERLAQNIALQREGYDVDTFSGVAGAATQEALTGALGAAPISALVRPEVKPPESVDQFEKEKQEFREKFGTAEPVQPVQEAAPEEPATEFPGGYVATPREISRQETPEAYGIVPEGSDKPLTTVGTQEEAEAKLQTLTEIRGEEQARLVKESDKITSEIQAEQRKLDVMEATGQTDTDQYVQAKALFEQKQDEAAQKIEDINNQIVAYSAPLTIAPIGTRTQVQREYVVSRGDEQIGTFGSLEEAATTLQEREPELFKQAEEEARVKADDRVQELKQTLTPMLAKFGLQDVGLNIVDKIENDAGGRYLNSLIDISLKEDNPIQTMRHESLHALKDLEFFTPQQWRALTERANKQWIKEYLADVPTELNGVQMSRLDAYKQLGLTQEEIVEEAIADAFGAYDRGATPPPGMIAALFKKLKNFFTNFGQALRGAGFESADDVFQRVERGELKSRKPKAKEPAKEAKPTPEVVEQAEKYAEENGIMPYVSEGGLELPTKAPKYSLQKFNPEKHLSFDPTLGVPINRDGTVTVYYHTTKAQALEIGKSKVIPAEGRNRVYLTNESGGDSVLRNRGSFDQDLDGSTVLVYVTPDMLQVDAEYPNGRRDFFIPLEEGSFFNKKMKMQSIQKGRDEAITGEFSYSDHEAKMTKAVGAYKNAPAAERKKMLAQARKTLKNEHNVGSLLSENGKLEKTRVGEYGLAYDGNSVASQGLGLAAAQKITDKVSTCPRSAICEGLCLGETSGGNFLFGGTATEDVADIKKSAFRAGPRMMQYLKTEALIINPEAFSILLQAEIDSLKKWSASPTQVKIDPETKKRLNVEKEIYQPAVRLNVTSDFKPEMFRAIIEGNPDVQFYDYTKLGNEPLSDNHHLTYSSTGFGQIVNGEKVFFKTKAGQYDHNWATMRKRLDKGQNVAMAFSSKSALPKTLLDEETKTEYKIWDGDDYDARFLDPKQPDGKGMIIGLRNKAGNLSEKNATERTGGFFVQYNPKTDGDTVVVPDQAQFKDGGRKVIPLAKGEKLSLRTSFPSVKAVKEAVKDAGVPNTAEFKRFIAGNQWNDADGKPMMFYHATAREFFEFTPAGQSQAIFLATTPEEAETFGGIAEDNLRKEIYEKLLNKEEKLNLFQKVVDAEVKKGSMTAKQGEQFMRQVDRKAPKYGDFGDIEQEMYDALLDLSPTRMSIMPLFARAETPFDFENKEQLDQVMEWFKNNTDYPQEFAENWLNSFKGRVAQGLWQAIEDKRFQQALKALGYDGFTVREGRNGPKNYAVYKPEQVKSITGNLGEFGRESKNIKYSLPNIPQNLEERIGETTSKRERKTFFQNIVEAITPNSAADFRAKYLNRYNQMSVYDKKLAEEMGGAALLADQSAESAALMSDLGAGVAASAMGFEDRNGGIPVLRNGITTIDKSVKGLIASLAPLAQYNDPAVYQRYQYWAMVKRGQRLNKEGKLTGIDSADVAFAKMLEERHPEFVGVQKDLIAFNNGLVQYMVDTGVLSKERGQMYTKYADYIPFYRQMDGDTTLGPNLFQSLSGVKPPKKLKGADAAEAPLADFLETMVRNTQSSIQAGIKNYAAQRALNVATKLKAPGMGAERLNYSATGPDIINVLEKGNLVSYRTPDTLLVNAMMSLNQSELPFIGFLSAPADLLRNLVTKEPGFMMANMMRDSLSAWVTSGQKMTPIAGTVINFGKGLARKSPGFEAMLDAGIIGGYEFSENIEKSGFKLEDDLAKKAGKKDPIYLRPFTSVWDALGKGTTASDAATRALIYERVLADTGNEAEALYRSLEVMNFHRKGSSPLIRVLTAAVPFFNARLQGLDLFYRASTGNMNNKDAASIQRQFFARGMTMMALSGLYWMLVSDDEEYKKQEQETKDNNWIIPAIGAKIPIPFEVGVLFKVIPERIMAYTFGNDTGEDLKKSMIRNAVATFAFNPIPQTVKPVLEAVVDYNMFTMRPILGQGMKDIEPEFQVGPSTSNFAKVLAQSLGLSPIKVDHIIKGYTGTIGMYAIDTIDIVLDQFGDSPKPTKRFEQLPVIKRFASDPEARGFVTQYYELKDAVDTTVRTMNLLEKTAQPEEYVDYLIKNQGTLAFKDYVLDTERTMKDLREMKTAIRSSTMTGDEKRDALLEISRMESAITSNIQDIKQAIAKAQ
jgi:polyhydroxyalkanoate synthesis regulator phasin